MNLLRDTGVAPDSTTRGVAARQPIPGGRARARLRPEEIIMIVFLLALAMVAVLTGIAPVTAGQTLTSPGLLGALLIVGLSTFLVGYYRTRDEPWPRPTRLRTASAQAGDTLRAFIVPLACVASYTTLHDLTPLVRPDLYDSWLIAFDRAVFGVDVSRWLNDQFGSGWLTAVMTICYITYGSAQAAYALSRYFGGQVRAFHDFALALAITGVVGYSGYLLVPALGPHIYQAELFPEPLPGHAGVIGGILDAITTLQGEGRDVFPSLHTAMTVVLLMCAWRDARRWFWWNLPVALGLIMSTMYLRKHYAVDVLAGLLLAASAVVLARLINRWWYRGGAPRAAWPRPVAVGGRGAVSHRASEQLG